MPELPKKSEFQDNTQKVLRALEDGQRELLATVRDDLENQLKTRYKSWATDKAFGVKVVGKTTVTIEMGEPGIYLEFGTATRGEPGKASGKPYNVPKPDLTDPTFGGPNGMGREFFRTEQAYRIEYRFFRTKDGKVKSIPKKVPIQVERGRRPGKKALHIPGIGFRARVKNHPGIFPHPIIRPTIYDLQDKWGKLADSVYARVAKRYGVAARD